MKKKLFQVRRLEVLAATAAVTLGSAQAVAPIDLEDAGVELAGYVGGAATAGLAVFVAIYGIRVIIRAFRAVK